MTDTSFSRRTLFKGAGLIAAGATASSGFVQPVFAEKSGAFPVRPIANRFKLGDFEVTTLFDGALQLDGPHPIFGQNAEAADVQKLAKENFLPEKRMEIGFTPTLIRTGENLVLFDAGNGDSTNRRPNAGNLVAIMKHIGISPDDITHVVITHMHPDHIGGLMEGGKPVFQNAAYITNADEYDFWTAEERLSGETERTAKLVQANIKPLAEKFSFVKAGNEILPGISALEAAGHTPGHMAIHVEDKGERLVLIGDAANHYVVSLQRPDWHVRFDMDKEKAVETRKQLLGMIAADKIPFIGYHMPFPSVGYLETKNAGFRYEAASYQLNL